MVDVMIPETRATLALIMVLGVGSVGDSAAQPDPWRIDVATPSREVIFTNKEASHFATDTGARDQRSYGGLFTSMHKSLSDWVMAVDGETLEPRSASAQVWPWMLRRLHESTTTEEIFIPDALPALLVRFEGDHAEFTLTPRVDLRWIWETPRPAYETVDVEGILCIRRTGWKPGAGAHPWLAIAFSSPTRFSVSSRHVTTQHPRDAARKAMGTTHPYEPGHFVGAWPESGVLDVAFVQGPSAEDAAAQARHCLSDRDNLLESKRGRIEALFTRAHLGSGDARLDQAYRWARASMDALVMNARGRGIYAGFHWFPNYWSRDTFICLSGATLVTGQHEEARDILRSFLQFQMLDRASPRLGRLPNIVNPGDLQYAGVDGTWWYARAAYRYLKSREAADHPDEEFEREFMGALRMMIEGAETKAVDEHGFLTHGDGETWMDAGGEEQPRSPRGSRAVEVQALYYNALRIAEHLARKHQREGAAAKYAALADRTRAAFGEHFWDTENQTLFDHLNPDGTGDTQIRPNVILAITGVEPEWPALVTDTQYASIVDRAHRHLVKPYGVLSLDAKDAAFHPRHLDLDNYYYDDAYHNGDVWLWLSGPMITALVRTGRVDEARAMLDPLVAEVLDHGAVGSIREIRDGADTGQTEEFGGATYQAWSLAEFIRALHEDLAPALGW